MTKELNEIFDNAESIENVEKVEKVKKPRKPMSEETKAKLRVSLQKARDKKKQLKEELLAYNLDPIENPVEVVEEVEKVKKPRGRKKKVILPIKEDKKPIKKVVFLKDIKEEQEEPAPEPEQEPAEEPENLEVNYDTEEHEPEHEEPEPEKAPEPTPEPAPKLPKHTNLNRKKRRNIYG